jgi:hypothetical protein
MLKEEALKYKGKKVYVRTIDPEIETALLKLVDYLQVNGFFFYTLSERNEGSNRYVDVNISIKLA